MFVWPTRAHTHGACCGNRPLKFRMLTGSHEAPSAPQKGDQGLGRWKIAVVGAPTTPGGGGGAGQGALLAGPLILAVFWQKICCTFRIAKGANGHFSGPPRRADSKSAIFIIFLVFGLHVRPMQTVCPVMASQKSPTPRMGINGRC